MIAHFRAGARPWFAASLFLLAFVFGATICSAQTIPVGPVPAFVRSLDIPAPRQERLRQVEGARYDLVYDVQVRVEPKRETTYQRRVYKILDRSGLEDGAQTQVDFDPSYEQLVLHDVRIIRDGKAIDLTRRVDIDILRKESELDDGILTGVRTALLRLPDVRVGDIVDFSWSWQARPLFWAGHYFGGVDLGWAVPVGVTRFRLDMPAGQPVQVYRYLGTPPATLQRAGGRDIREWVSMDPDPIVQDDDTPDWHDPWPGIRVSTMASWRQVVDWALPLYRDAAFPRSLETQAARIEAEGSSAEIKAVKALRWVQDNIRYTSLSIGPGSYQPRPPGEVVAQGWGDCKDKAQLLVSFLRRLGISAWPALTDIDHGPVLDRRPPSPGAFDHVVVLIRIGQKDFWVDPTADHQGGALADLAPLPERKALPLRPGQADLASIPFPPSREPEMDVVETFRLGPAGMTLDVVTLYRGGLADDMRARVAAKAVEALEGQYLGFYVSDYPGLKIARPLRIGDDRAANRLEIRESYALPANAYGALLDRFPVRASALAELYTYANGDGRRRHPMALNYPVNRKHRIVLITPGMNASSPGDEAIDGRAFVYTRKSTRDGDKLTIDFTLLGKGPLLKPEDFDQFRKDADALANDTDWTLAIGSDVARDDDAMLVFAIGFCILIGLSLFGLLRARAIGTRDDDAILYPVPPPKLFWLTVASWGLYQVYWCWRNWRWIKRHDGAAISPFWRAFFMIFWLYPLFSHANGRAARPLPNWLGVSGAALFAITYFGTTLIERFVPTSFYPTLFSFLAVIFVMPTAVAVNRCNAAERIARNGRLDWLGIATFFVGTAALVAMIVEAS